MKKKLERVNIVSGKYAGFSGRLVKVEGTLALINFHGQKKDMPFELTWTMFRHGKNTLWVHEWVKLQDLEWPEVNEDDLI